MTHFFPREILDEDLVEEMARLKHRRDVLNLSKITKCEAIVLTFGICLLNYENRDRFVIFQCDYELIGTVNASVDNHSTNGLDTRWPFLFLLQSDKHTIKKT